MLIIAQKWLKFERSPAGLPIGWGKQKIKKKQAFLCKNALMDKIWQKMTILWLNFGISGG